MTDAPPKFVYRLATAAEWRDAKSSGVVPLRDIDEKDGYVHLSTRDQVIATANIHFKGAADLLALEIPLAVIEDRVKFELAPKRGEAFPHLYDRLRARDVCAAIALIQSAGGFAFGEAS